MKKVFILSLFLVTQNLYADFSIFAGFGLVDDYFSKTNSDLVDRPASKHSGALAIDLGLSTNASYFVALYTGLSLNLGGGRINYNHEDSGVTDLDTKVFVTDYRAHLGLRFNLFNFLLFGGGVTGGSMNYGIRLAEKETIQAAGGPVEESASIWGPYGEAGLGFMGKEYGAALFGRYQYLKSKPFAILGGKRLIASEKSARFHIFFTI